MDLAIRCLVYLLSWLIFFDLYFAKVDSNLFILLLFLQIGSCFDAGFHLKFFCFLVLFIFWLLLLHSTLYKTRCIFFWSDLNNKPINHHFTRLKTCFLRTQSFDMFSLKNRAYGVVGYLKDLRKWYNLWFASISMVLPNLQDVRQHLKKKIFLKNTFQS